MGRVAVFVASFMAVAAPLAAQANSPFETDPQPQSVERQIRQRLAHVVQRELALDDAGMRRLQATVQRFEAPRRDVLRRENEARRGLREELRANDAPREERVATLLDELLAAQKRRIELHEEEDRELRSVLTPVQRARYYGLQEQVRRRIEEVQRRRADVPGPRGAPRGRRPPA